MNSRSKSSLPPALLLARALLGGAFLLALWLAWETLAAGPVITVVGNPDGGPLLATRWSRVLGMPVAIPGAVVYLAALFLLGPRTFSGIRLRVILPLGLVMVAAAGYFLAIQAWVLGRFSFPCLLAHGLALAAVASVVAHLGREVDRAPVLRRWAKGMLSPVTVAMAAMAAGGFYLLQASEAGSRAGWWFSIGDPAETAAPARLLIRPFRAEDQVVGLALHGGERVIYGQETIRLRLGRPASLSELVPLALVHDWSDPACRRLLSRLRDLLDGPEAESLPPVELYLLPAFESSAGENLHRVLLQAHFISASPGLIGALVDGLLDGSLAVESEAVRERIATLDPAAATAWEAVRPVVEEQIQEAFGIARQQRQRVASAVGRDPLPQLLALDAALVGGGSAATLKRFLQTAGSRQQAFFRSPAGAQLISLIQGCDCGLEGVHFHDPGDPFFERLRAAWPDFGASPPPPDGPQLHFELATVFADPIARDGTATATFTFSNTGTEPLEIGDIQPPAPGIRIDEVTRTVPPAGAGVISLHFDSKGLAPTAGDDYRFSFWVDSNSTQKEDPRLGHEIQMTVPLGGEPP